nr:formimidoylglutamase [Bacteroidota bacterium]
MEIALYFNPVDPNQINFAGEENGTRLGDVIIPIEDADNDDYLKTADIVLIGVNEDRGSVNNSGCGAAPNEIRKYLYQLTKTSGNLRIADVGNIKQGKEITDTYFALKTTLVSLLESGTIPVILGGGQDLTYAVYLAYEELGKVINMVSVDSMFDLAKNDDVLDSGSFLSRIILHKPNYLFNYANLGYQSHFVELNAIRLLNNLYFDIYRLGLIQNAMEEAEPVIRNADTLTFDISSIRQSDAPGNGNASPNGFYGEEVCQIMRYAGMSEKLSSIGFFEINPVFDRQGQTAHLTAQMIWYFLDGRASRIDDFPDEEGNHIKYIVNITESKEDIIFYKSKVTDRWWMEIPVGLEVDSRLRRHVMVPCSYNDYKTACNNEIPDLWWKAFQKLM